MYFSQRNIERKDFSKTQNTSSNMTSFYSLVEHDDCHNCHSCTKSTVTSEDGEMVVVVVLVYLLDSPVQTQGRADSTHHRSQPGRAFFSLSSTFKRERYKLPSCTFYRVTALLIYITYRIHIIQYTI